MTGKFYYVQMKCIDGPGTSGHNTSGFFYPDEGTYSALPGLLPGCNRVYRAEDLPEDVVMLVSFDQGGKLRSIEERKHVAALAEAHGFRVRRGPPSAVKAFYNISD